MKVAVYGGTFDPIHVAHLLIAEQAYEELSLHKLILMPAAVSPHKTGTDTSSAKHRLNMLKLAVQANGHFKVSDYELKKGGTSYTVDTLQCLSYNESLDKDSIFLLIGGDNLSVIDKWKQPERIFQLCNVVVARRPTYEINQLQNPFLNKVRFLDTPLIDVSASSIRTRVAQGKSIRYLVPETVENYIVQHKLYQ